MASSLGSSILRLLRVLTPHLVVELTDAVEEKNKHKLEIINEPAEEVIDNSINSLMEGMTNISQAKILDFNQVTTVNQEAIAKISIPVESNNQFLKSLGIHQKVLRSVKKVVGGEEFSDETEDTNDSSSKEELISTTVFILQEKEKLKKSQNKLNGQDAIKIYKFQAAIDTSNEDKEDLSQSSSTGILVAKRQF